MLAEEAAVCQERGEESRGWSADDRGDDDGDRFLEGNDCDRLAAAEHPGEMMVLRLWTGRTLEGPATALSPQEPRADT